VGQWAAGRQQVVGVPDFEGFEFAAHAAVLFDGGPQSFLERIDTVFVIARGIFACFFQDSCSGASRVHP